MHSRRLLLALASSAAATLHDGPPKDGQHFDYVIVGGGTAGLVMANRLSADPSVTVAVLEAGSQQRDNPNVTDVDHFAPGIGTDIDWKYLSEPQRFAGNASGPGKPQLYDQGLGLGGTSLINGATYIRSTRAQIDAWETAFGNPGWNWNALFKCYLKSERFQVPTPAQANAGAMYDKSANGFDGPLDVGWQNSLTPPDAYRDVKASWEAVGFPQTPDMNTGFPSDFGLWPRTLNRKLNIRWDAAQAYLYPVINRTNLDVFQKTVGERLVWLDGCDKDNATASGVVARAKDAASAAEVRVFADKEVIISAGTIKSPAFLEASGVGNPSILSKHNIPVRVALPSVGENLQDQSLTSIVVNPPPAGANFTGYPTFVTYPNASSLFGANASAVEAHVRSKIPEYAAQIVNNTAPGGTTQAIQERLLTTLANLTFDSATPAAEILTALAGPALLTPFWGLLPFSRGSVHINGSSATSTPSINPNFFMVEWDATLQTATARLTRRFWTAARTAGWAGAESTPGLATVPAGATDAQWTTWAKGAYSPNYHPVGTCAMLARPLGGVVDAALRVHGVRRLRVVDASVLPSQTVGHLTSTIYAVAERAAALVRGLDGC